MTVYLSLLIAVIAGSVLCLALSQWSVCKLNIARRVIRQIEEEIIDHEGQDFVNLGLKYVLLLVAIIGIYWLSVAIVFTGAMLLIWFIIGWITILHEYIASIARKVLKERFSFIWNVVIAIPISFVLLAAFGWIWWNAAIIFVPLIIAFAIYVGPVTGIKILNHTAGKLQLIMARILLFWVVLTFAGWALLVTTSNGVVSFSGVERSAATLTASEFNRACMLRQDDVWEIPTIKRWRITSIDLTGSSERDLSFRATVRFYTWMKIPLETFDFRHEGGHSSCFSTEPRRSISGIHEQ